MPVVVKILKEAVTSRGNHGLLTKEISISSRLNHNNVIKFLGVYQTGNDEKMKHFVFSLQTDFARLLKTYNNLFQLVLFFRKYACGHRF